MSLNIFIEADTQRGELTTQIKTIHKQIILWFGHTPKLAGKRYLSIGHLREK
jgi:hypothetical protein